MSGPGGFASRVAAAASRVASSVGRRRWPTYRESTAMGEEAVNESQDRLQKLQQQSGHGRLIKASAKHLGRVIYLANIPLRLQLPPRCENLIELAFRCPPRTSKLEIKKVLQLVYGIDVKKVHTLNYDGKKKMHPSKKFFIRTSAYKKAYVVLNRPITLSKDLFPLNLFYDKESRQQQTDTTPGNVDKENA